MSIIIDILTGTMKLRDAWPKINSNFTGIKTEVDAIVTGSANAEVGQAHVSTVKSKTFTTLDDRLEEDEQDLVSYKAETTSELALKAIDVDVRKTAIKLKLVDVDTEFISAISGGTTISLESIPQQQSVNYLSLDTALKHRLTKSNTVIDGIIDDTFFYGDIDGYAISKASGVATTSIRLPFTSINDLLTVGATNNIEFTYRIYADKKDEDYTMVNGAFFKTYNTNANIENGPAFATETGIIPDKDASTINTISVVGATIPDATYYGVYLQIKRPTLVNSDLFLSLVDMTVNGTSILDRLITANVGFAFTLPEISSFTAENFYVEPHFTGLYVPRSYLDPTMGINKHADTKAGFLGDSITGGQSPGEVPSTVVIKYYDVLATRLRLTSAVGEAWTGSAIGREASYVDKRFTKRYLLLPTDLDIISVFGGTNDWSLNTVLGTMADAPNDEDNVSFYGSLHFLCQGMVTRWPNGKFFFMTPTPQNRTDVPYGMVNSLGKTLADYVNAIKEVCAWYSIPVLDLFTQSGLYPFDEYQRSVWMLDGLHWSQATHLKMGDRISRFMENL